MSGYFLPDLTARCNKYSIFLYFQLRISQLKVTVQLRPIMLRVFKVYYKGVFQMYIIKLA